MVATATIATAMLALLVACAIHPVYVPPPIVLTFSPGFQPPMSLNTGAYAGIAVTITNGPLNGGEVGFSCTPAGACGTFTPGSAPSTVPVCYLAPDSVPNGNTVTVTATYGGSGNAKPLSAMITIVNGAGQPCP